MLCCENWKVFPILFGSDKNEVNCNSPTAKRNQANSQKSGQDDGVIPNVFEISSYDERLDDLPILEIFKIWDVVAKRTSTSEDYVCNQFKSLLLPLQVLPLDIVENENSLL